MSYEKICSGCHQVFAADQTVCPACGTLCPNDNPGGALPAGLYLAKRYVIGRVRDVDGEGITYEAIDQQTELPVILKEYLPVTLCAKRDEDGAVVVRAGSEVPYKTTLVDFVDLYKNLMQLAGRPGLERVTALFKANNTVYAVMEYQKSISLTDWLNRQTELLPFDRCYALLDPVFDGLAAMHSAGLVHRGVCPDNIRITPQGQAFLSGYATLALRALNSELKPCLYEGYSAPEQYSTTEFQGPYTDVYSLAAVLYKMLAGTAPVATAGRIDGCPTLRQIGAQVSSQVSRAVDHAMWGDIGQRTASIAGLREELDGEKAGLGSTRVVGGVPARPGRKENNNLPLIIGGCVVLGLVAALLIWQLIRGQVPQGGSSLASSAPVSSAPASSSAAAPTPTPTPAPEKVQNFVGLAYSDLQADAALQQKYIFNVTERYSDNVESGKVISQDPLEGQPLPADHRIELVVSKGPQSIKVPEYRNYTRGDVITVLTGAGIKLENIRFTERANDGTMAPGQSVGGDREVGSSMNPELDIITVYMAGPAPTPTPTPAASQSSVVVPIQPADPQGEGGAAPQP